MKRSRAALAAAGSMLAAGVLVVSATVTPTVAQEVREVTLHLSTWCTPDAAGECTISHPLGEIPETIHLEERIPQGWVDYTAHVVRGSDTARSFRVEAVPLRGGTRPGKLYLDVTIKGTVAVDPPPPPTTTTEPEPTVDPTTTTAAPTTTVDPTTTPPPAGDEPLSLPRIPWEGGPAYYKQFPETDAAGWDDPSFFPIGVWFESVTSQDEIDLDKAAGINTYVELVGDQENKPLRTDLIRSSGMYAIPGPAAGGKVFGSEKVGSLLDDEVDMRNGPGWGPVANGTCSTDEDCGYTVMQAREDATQPMRWTNYGKGVIFWETDAQAEVFVNAFQDIPSVDVYFYTDEDTCVASQGGWLLHAPNPRQLSDAECHRAWNYGATMDELRKLDACSEFETTNGIEYTCKTPDPKLQPLGNFVEVDHPGQQGRDITGPQIQGAVMSSLIHEARMITYFNHSFGGDCISQHVLRDECGAANRPYVTEINALIKTLAPVLNTQSLEHDFGTVDTMLKWHNGSYYLFAMQEAPTGGSTQEFTLPAGLNVSSVEVLNEGRSIDVVGGKFSDSFAAEYSYHVYKITP